ncbi:MAG: hypothetical protein KF812_00800 [Fimbriimonadaceae bacterium]|nr:hypothetical protein [Fimbriimonadaceae bacterium]
MKRNLLILFGVIVVALLSVGFVVASRQPSDEALIRDSLESAVAASRDGAPGSLYAELSRSLEVNGQMVGRDPEVNEFIKKLKPEIALGEYTPVVDGDTATVTTAANVTFGLGNFSNTQVINRVEIEFARERATKWVFIPTHKWRITKVSAPDFVAPDY